MAISRREAMSLGLSLGAGLCAGPSLLGWPRASAEPLAAFPTGGGTDQTAALQAALDQASRAGMPLFLPPGIYATRRLILKSGVCLRGIPGETVLHCHDPKGLLQVTSAIDVRIEGLVLEGAGFRPESEGALLSAVSVEGLHVSRSRLVGATEHGIVLKRVSGSITDCEFDGIGKIGILGKEVADLSVYRNRMHHCGRSPIHLIAAGECRISGNVVECARGIAVTQANCASAAESRRHS
jgi:hypothetical protein